MALIAKMETLVGTIDGVNRTFTTPGGEAYVAGSEVVFWEGIPRRIDWDDGWVETDPGAGVVTLKEAPLEGDDLQMLYAIVSSVDTEVTEMSGSITVSGDLAGTIETVTEITGALHEISSLAGDTEAVSELEGAIDDPFEIQGLVEEIL